MKEEGREGMGREEGREHGSSSMRRRISGTGVGGKGISTRVLMYVRMYKPRMYML